MQFTKYLRYILIGYIEKENKFDFPKLICYQGGKYGHSTTWNLCNYCFNMRHVIFMLSYEPDTSWS